MLNYCDFIQVFVFTSYHHLKVILNNLIMHVMSSVFYLYLCSLQTRRPLFSLVVPMLCGFESQNPVTCICCLLTTIVVTFLVLIEIPKK